MPEAYLRGRWRTQELRCGALDRAEPLSISDPRALPTLHKRARDRKAQSMEDRQSRHKKRIPDSQDSRSLLRGRVLSLLDSDSPVTGATLQVGDELFPVDDQGVYAIPLDGCDIPVQLLISAPGYFQRVELVDWTPILPGGLLMKDFFLLNQGAVTGEVQEGHLIAEPAPLSEPLSDLDVHLFDALTLRLAPRQTQAMPAPIQHREGDSSAPRSHLPILAPASLLDSQGTYIPLEHVIPEGPLPAPRELDLLLERLSEHEEQLLVTSTWMQGNGGSPQRDELEEDDSYTSLLGSESSHPSNLTRTESRIIPLAGDEDADYLDGGDTWAGDEEFSDEERDDFSYFNNEVDEGWDLTPPVERGTRSETTSSRRLSDSRISALNNIRKVYGTDAELVTIAEEDSWDFLLTDLPGGAPAVTRAAAPAPERHGHAERAVPAPPKPPAPGNLDDEDDFSWAQSEWEDELGDETWSDSDSDF